jgi:hypothetical protein
MEVKTWNHPNILVFTYLNKCIIQNDSKFNFVDLCFLE